MAGTVLFTFTPLAEFLLTFEVEPTGTTSSGWTNLLAFGDESQRYPSIWFHPGQVRLHVSYNFGSFNTVDQAVAMTGGTTATEATT